MDHVVTLVTGAKQTWAERDGGGDSGSTNKPLQQPRREPSTVPAAVSFAYVVLRLPFTPVAKDMTAAANPAGGTRAAAYSTMAW